MSGRVRGTSSARAIVAALAAAVMVGHLPSPAESLEQPPERSSRTNSLGDLASVRSQIVDLMEKGYLEPLVAVGMNTKSNVVDVYTRSDRTRVEEELVDLGLPLRAISILKGPRHGILTASQFPPYEAGHRLIVDGPGAHNPRCSSGFLGRASDGGKTRYFGITAGHCGKSGWGIKLGRWPGKYVSDIGLNALRCRDKATGAMERCGTATSDAARFHVSEDKASYRIHAGSTHLRPVDELTSRQLTRGMTLCFRSGTQAKEICGQVIKEDIAARYDEGEWSDGLIDHLWCLDVSSKNGDSGAPVFSRRPAGLVDAAGIVAAHWEDVGMCFSPMDRVLDDLQLDSVSPPRTDQLSAYSPPVTSGPVTVWHDSYGSGRDCSSSQFLLEGKLIASRRFCSFYYVFEPDDREKEHGILWMQATVTPMPGWCVRRFFAGNALTDDVQIRGATKGSFDLKSSQKKTLSIKTRAGDGHGAGLVTQSAIVHAGSLTALSRAHSSKVGWRGRTSRTVAVAGGLEVKVERDGLRFWVEYMGTQMQPCGGRTSRMKTLGDPPIFGDKETRKRTAT